MGKNQVEIKDNHGHTTKVHRKDVKKIPKTEKVCNLYEEEQVGKTRESRKAVPTSKIPDLKWDIAETQSLEENQKKSNMTLTLQTIVTITIMITTVLKQITAYMEKFPRLIGKITQVIRYATIKASHNIFFQNIKVSYKTAVLAVAIATNMTDRTSCNEPTRSNSRSSLNFPDMRKPHDVYDDLYQTHTPRNHNISSN